MTEINEKYHGLDEQEVLRRRAKYGSNSFVDGERESRLKKALKSFLEPIFLLLTGAACIYFLLGEPRDGAVMLAFVIFMSAINIYQEWKTDKTLETLKSLSSPKVTARRGGYTVEIASEDLVPGDIIVVSEGERVAAD